MGGGQRPKKKFVPANGLTFPAPLIYFICLLTSLMSVGTWAAEKHSEAGYGRPVDRGVWTANTVKRPRQQPAHPQYANYWAPLTRKRHTMPHSAQSQHANYWAPRTRKRHQQEHRLQRSTERSDPTQHAKGRTGDCPGPCKGATTRRNVTQGVGRPGLAMASNHPPPRKRWRTPHPPPSPAPIHDWTCHSHSDTDGRQGQGQGREKGWGQE